MQLTDAIAPAPRVRILIGDSEEVIARTLAAILELAGCAVCALYGGKDAARLLSLLGARFDVVDLSARGPAVQLPHPLPLQMDRCKVLLFTGQTRLYDILRTEAELGTPFDVLVCPVKATELLHRLKSSFCSEYPPLLVPFETGELQVH